MKTTIGGVEGELTTSCRYCHRALQDPESIALGAGPVCRAKYGVGAQRREPGPAGGVYGLFQKGRSWTFVLEGDFVVVTDTGTGRTVTNDAENVVMELGRHVGLANRRIIYRDTDGRWDELLHDGPHFRGFAPIGVTGTYLEAIAAARAPKACPTHGVACPDGPLLGGSR